MSEARLPDPARVAEILGGRKVLKRDIRTLGDMDAAIRAGLPKAAFRAVALSFNLDAGAAHAVRGEFASFVASFATVNRPQPFSPEASERLERAARLLAQAVDAFGGDKAAASGWLWRPNQMLGDRRPIDLARTELGMRQVEQVLAGLTYDLPA